MRVVILKGLVCVLLLVAARASDTGSDRRAPTRPPIPSEVNVKPSEQYRTATGTVVTKESDPTLYAVMSLGESQETASQLCRDSQDHLVHFKGSHCGYNAEWVWQVLSSQGFATLVPAVHPEQFRKEFLVVHRVEALIEELHQMLATHEKRVKEHKPTTSGTAEFRAVAFIGVPGHYFVHEYRHHDGELQMRMFQAWVDQYRLIHWLTDAHDPELSKYMDAEGLQIFFKARETFGAGKWIPLDVWVNAMRSSDREELERIDLLRRVAMDPRRKAGTAPKMPPRKTLAPFGLLRNPPADGYMANVNYVLRPQHPEAALGEAQFMTFNECSLSSLSLRGSSSSGSKKPTVSSPPHSPCKSLDDYTFLPEDDKAKAKIKPKFDDDWWKTSPSLELVPVDDHPLKRRDSDVDSPPPQRAARAVISSVPKKSTTGITKKD